MTIFVFFSKYLTLLHQNEVMFAHMIYYTSTLNLSKVQNQLKATKIAFDIPWKHQVKAGNSVSCPFPLPFVNTGVFDENVSSYTNLQI